MLEPRLPVVPYLLGYATGALLVAWATRDASLALDMILGLALAAAGWGTLKSFYAWHHRETES